MGMFDWYFPAEELHCPIDDEPLTGWQGGDGRRALVEWHEGVKEPGDEWFVEGGGETLNSDQRARWTLPSTFRMYTFCPRGHRVVAIGTAHDGVWNSTEIVSPE